MKVADILRIERFRCEDSGAAPNSALLSGHLRAAQIGALVVSVTGIPSMASYLNATSLMASRRMAPGYLRFPISELMTKAVVCLLAEDSITDLMKPMTQRRIRHVPVKDGDQLVGIISIGDVLKHRLGELQVEANVLRDYAAAARH